MNRILNEKEKTLRDKWLKIWEYNYEIDLEETAEGSRSYYYEIHPSNIGDTIFICYKNYRANITDYESRG